MAAPVRFDLSDPTFDVTSDVVHAARAQRWWVETNLGWALLRYEESAALLADRRFQQGNAKWPEQNGIHSGRFAGWWKETLLSLEGDDHRRIRRLLMPAFRSKVIAAMRPRFQALAHELVDSDPDAARALLAEATATTGSALGDIRDVVRGIHPPVLADRGLSGAVDALALDLAVPVTVSLHHLGRLPAPVESAVYFAVVECLANVGKHAEADHAWVELSHRDGVVTAVVGDDGRGGADPDAGTGLHGVARRLAAFDGSVRVSSPAGGPTLVTLEVPCESSSPRTTPSSGTA